MVTADLYLAHEKSATFIVLFHQARWSRGEYREIASKLNSLGYNCLAVDQRSGGEVNGVVNETARDARKKMKPTSYIDAIPDMLSAITYSRKNLAEGKLFIWGSSYSSSLVLKIAGDEPDIADAVLAFSPGEYFGGMGKPRDFISSSTATIMIPVFITSAKSEEVGWRKIFDAIPSGKKKFYLPPARGKHGSSALWDTTPDSPGYWDAVTEFLSGI